MIVSVLLSPQSTVKFILPLSTKGNTNVFVAEPAFSVFIVNVNASSEEGASILAILPIAALATLDTLAILALVTLFILAYAIYSNSSVQSSPAKIVSISL